ncbi:unnamed protein product [Dicrocoelium dendriticum]|nr:unnamed protein product [Dicrocoelium dendriticum]
MLQAPTESAAPYSSARNLSGSELLNHAHASSGHSTLCPATHIPLCPVSIPSQYHGFSLSIPARLDLGASNQHVGPVAGSQPLLIPPSDSTSVSSTPGSTPLDSMLVNSQHSDTPSRFPQDTFSLPAALLGDDEIPHSPCTVLADRVEIELPNPASLDTFDNSLCHSLPLPAHYSARRRREIPRPGVLKGYDEKHKRLDNSLLIVSFSMRQLLGDTCFRPPAENLSNCLLHPPDSDEPDTSNFTDHNVPMIKPPLPMVDSTTCSSLLLPRMATHPRSPSIDRIIESIHSASTDAYAHPSSRPSSAVSLGLNACSPTPAVNTLGNSTFLHPDTDRIQSLLKPKQSGVLTPNHPLTNAPVNFSPANYLASCRYTQLLFNSNFSDARLH